MEEVIKLLNIEKCADTVLRPMTVSFWRRLSPGFTLDRPLGLASALCVDGLYLATFQKFEAS